MSIINMKQDCVFEVNFNFQRNDKFICTRSTLVDTIKQYDQNGIQSIKMYDGKSFKRVSKSKILDSFKKYSFDYLFLKSHYYFN